MKEKFGDDNHLVEITPKPMLCAIGLCPAIFRDTNGDFVIVGEKAVDAVPSSRVAPHETVIRIPKALLADLIAGR